MMAGPCNRHASTKQGLVDRVVRGLALVIGLSGIQFVADEVWAQTSMRHVGILSFAPVADDPNIKIVLGLFREKLASRGWVEGVNVVFEYANAHGDPSRFPEAAMQLSVKKVDVIFATSAPALRAAFAATQTIPIVAGDFTTDPVAQGYVRNYAQPGGNVTGVFLDAPEFAGKWFELLRAMIPGLASVAVLGDPGPGATHLHAVRNAAKLLSLELQVIEVKKPEELTSAFEALNTDVEALIFLPSPMIYNRSARLAALTLEHGLPATSMAREFALAGGTLAYGPERASVWERLAVFVARILDGADPARLPVERPARIQLVVNLETARTLGIRVPDSVLLRADELVR
jgi:ABC-type uncharacterized transport system substrate-binding protein